VNKVKIQIVEADSFQARLESGFDALGPMISVPQLCGNKDAFACDPSRGKFCLQRFSHFALVPVSLCAIEMPKSSRHRIPRCGYRHGWFGNQGAKTECRHLATSVIE
jgi:hypothetical protein